LLIDPNFLTNRAIRFFEYSRDCGYIGCPCAGMAREEYTRWRIVASGGKVLDKPVAQA
jgi:hypothetical protein